MRTCFVLTLLALAAPVFAQGGQPKKIEKLLDKKLNGALGEQPATEYVYEMKSKSREVILHLEYKRGLHRLSKHKHARGTTAGVYIEVNDADGATHPVRNPFCPLPVQRKWNVDWKEFVDAKFPHPNPQAGYWYTWAKTRSPLKRPIRLRFAEAGRFRIRIRGVTREHRKNMSAATLTGVTEILSGPAPDYRKRVVDDLVRVTRFVPTGRRRTSVLLLERELPNNIRVGVAFQYTIRVTNLRDQPVTDIVLRESGDGTLDYKKGVRAELGGAATWNLGTIPPKGSKTLKITAIAVKPGPLRRALSVRYDSSPLAQTVSVGR